MKYRSSFVSNSSSSSFCIIGFYANKLSEDEFWALEEKYGSELSFEEGYDCGQVIGLWAESYLEDNSIKQAIPIVLNDIKEKMSPDDFNKLVETCGKLDFIYDYGDN